MRSINRLLVVCASLLICGCTSNSQTPGTSQGQTATAGAAVTATEGVTIDFSSEPDPPKTGDNTIEVTVRQPNGTAITDAAVTAVFSMPAMPAMNMPAMRAEAKLTHVEGGRYQGMGQLAMAGTWNVTVTATRDGEPIGRRSFSIVAK
ncbi:MAG TPA: FixH family protein [Vicinamibacterales bacterium]|nr:FixH family protein [Vicinamibacterales bacterium]